jgi:hypothetical protein
MTRGLVVFTLALAQLFSPAVAHQISAVTPAPPTSSAFLPAVGQTTQYQYSDTLTTPKGSRRFRAALTLTSITAQKIRASIAIDGKETHRVDFYLDDTGMLQPVSMPEPEVKSTNPRRNSPQNERAAAVQAFVSRISLASRMGTQPTEETSFRVKVIVPGASCPLNPTLVFRASQPATLVADANDTTSVSSPQGNRRLFMPLGLGIGAGFIGGAIGGTPGRLIGISISATSLVVSLARSRHSGPSPADVSLHIDGKLADGRLQALSGDQEVIVHGKQTRTISDKWSLVAESEVSAGL